MRKINLFIGRDFNKFDEKNNLIFSSDETLIDYLIKKLKIKKN